MRYFPSDGVAIRPREHCLPVYLLPASIYRRKSSVQNLPFLLLLLACLLLAACQSHRRQEANRAMATLNVLNQVALIDIAREKKGDPPPRSFATWPAYWHHHFGTLRFTPTNHDRNNTGLRDVGSLNLAFVKQKRSEAGLPPFD